MKKISYFGEELNKVEKKVLVDAAGNEISRRYDDRQGYEYMCKNNKNKLL
jgi:hypothetical protein